ncbi:helix-turn-helix domain-containing protein [Ekhidna sp.]
MEGQSIGKEFGSQLRKLRLEKGLSQERLALNSGYHPTYISHLETGKKLPTLETLIELSKSLGTNLTILLEPFI